jgi:hypothetical protein
MAIGKRNDGSETFQEFRNHVKYTNGNRESDISSKISPGNRGKKLHGGKIMRRISFGPV